MSEQTELEEICRDIGRILAEVSKEAGVAFALVVTDFGPTGSTAYVSNIERKSFMKLLDELREKLRDHTQ